MPENAAHGLDLLDPDHEVVVTGEEDHQDVLRAWAPPAGPRRIAVELRPAPLRRGRHAGQPGLEALLDGRRIGELTQLMSVRYRARVDEVLRRGGRPGAVGLVRHGRHGMVEVELRLPDVTAAPVPRPVPAPGPGPRPVPVPPPGGGAPDPTPGRSRRRTPLLVGGGVLTLLIAVGTAVGGGVEPASPAPALAAPTATSPTSTPASTTTAAAATAPPATAPSRSDDDDRGAAPARIPSTTTRAPAPAPAARPAPRPDPQPRPAPARQPAPQPQPAPEPQAAPQPQAAPVTSTAVSEPEPRAVSYRNCDAVRAAGAAPIRRGDPGYAGHLDRDGDGEGCGGD